MSKPLYELTGDMKELEKLANDPEMAESVVDTMEGIEAEFSDKAIAIVKVSKNMDTDIDAIKAEIARLTARKKTMENRQQHMMTYLLQNMESTGIKKIPSPLFTLTYIAPKDMVVIDDEDKLPTDYVDIEMVKKPMKKDLLADLKKLEGDDKIEGCHLGKGKAGLRIS